MRKPRVVTKHGYEGELTAVSRILRMLKPFPQEARVRVLQYALDMARETNHKPIEPSELKQISRA